VHKDRATLGIRPGNARRRVGDQEDALAGQCIPQTAAQRTATLVVNPYLERIAGLVTLGGSDPGQGGRRDRLDTKRVHVASLYR
jgi:hypothetical protein